MWTFLIINVDNPNFRKIEEKLKDVATELLRI